MSRITWDVVPYTYSYILELDSCLYRLTGVSRRSPAGDRRICDCDCDCEHGCIRDKGNEQYRRYELSFAFIVSANRAESMYCLVLMIFGFSPSFSYSTTRQWLCAAHQSAAHRTHLPIHAVRRGKSMIRGGSPEYQCHVQVLEILALLRSRPCDHLEHGRVLLGKDEQVGDLVPLRSGEAVVGPPDGCCGVMSGFLVPTISLWVRYQGNEHAGIPSSPKSRGIPGRPLDSSQRATDSRLTGLQTLTSCFPAMGNALDEGLTTVHTESSAVCANTAGIPPVSSDLTSVSRAHDSVSGMTVLLRWLIQRRLEAERCVRELSITLALG
jgi:hypothetical protein